MILGKLHRPTTLATDTKSFLLMPISYSVVSYYYWLLDVISVGYQPSQRPSPQTNTGSSKAQTAGKGTQNEGEHQENGLWEGGVFGLPRKLETHHQDQDQV